jgi:hypothetical protein
MGLLPGRNPQQCRDFQSALEVSSLKRREILAEWDKVPEGWMWKKWAVAHRAELRSECA